MFENAINKIRIIVMTGLAALFIAVGSGGNSLRAAARKAPGAVPAVPDSQSEFERLDSLAVKALRYGDCDQVRCYAQGIKEIALETGDRDKMMKYYLYNNHALLASSVTDSLEYYFAESLALAEEIEDRSAMITIYSDMGIYAIIVELDYYKGLMFFMKALEMAEGYSSERQYCSLLGNVATTYNFRNDPAGLEYALELYNYGKRDGNTYFMATGAYIAASSYMLLKDRENALKYINEALAVIDEYGHHTAVYNLYGDILLAFGRDREAGEYYRKAIEYAHNEDALSVTNAYLSYGTYLLDKRQYGMAIDILGKGILISKEKNNPVHRYRLYEKISEAYRKTGDYHNALDYYMDFRQEADSVFSVERERSINQLRIQYEAEKKEQEITQNKLEIERGKRRLRISFAVVAGFAVALLAIFILYSKNRKSYKRIVRQHQESLNKESWYLSQIERLSNKQGAKYSVQNKYSVSSLTDEKGQKLFDKLESLMKDEHIYRDQELTRDKVAEMLSTNRTYLSQVINEHTGLSFNYYINSFRINEAVRILSEPGGDVLLKAVPFNVGFSSASTFYQLFQTAMGMSPSKYRDAVKSGKAGEA